jgi:hypothetical protein
MVKCRRATREELQTCHSEAYVHMYASSARHRDLAIFGESFVTRPQVDAVINSSGKV